MLWLYYNSRGQLLEYMTTGNNPRAGTTDFKIFAYFDGILAGVYSHASIKLRKPDYQESEYPSLLMEVDAIEVFPSGFASSYFVAGNTYTGFEFNFNDFNENHDSPILLDTPGMWKAVISLYSSGGSINVQGIASFLVENGIYNADGTEVSVEELLPDIYRALAGKISNLNGVIFLDTEPSADVLSENYHEGQLFYFRDEKNFYQLDGNGQLQRYEFDFATGIELDRSMTFVELVEKVPYEKAFILGNHIGWIHNFSSTMASYMLYSIYDGYLWTGNLAKDSTTTLNTILNSTPTKIFATQDYVDSGNVFDILAYNTTSGSLSDGSVAKAEKLNTKIKCYWDAAEWTLFIKLRNVYSTGHYWFSEVLEDPITESSGILTFTNRLIEVDPTAKTWTLHTNSDSFYSQTGAEGKFVAQTSSPYQLYGTKAGGTETTIGYGTQGGTGSIVQRDTNGNLHVPLTPGGDDMATSKKFVLDSITSAMTSSIVYQGSLTVAQINALDTSTLKIGYLYNVSDSGTLTIGSLPVLAGDNIVWTGTGWDKLTMDLSVYDDKFIAGGFFVVENYDEDDGEITIAYSSDLYVMDYTDSTGILEIEAI